ncbi:oligopeptide/dipeptide ABC transporter ATP-binding protein [Vulcanisaeta souniana]|uniref:Dipeptide/oligopeptide/nickel ABC transporter ATP-binding protein n=1 Tax=Vulcanisaeta souniana JCM 11219 TaxID=1293586 RepID=A0A830E8L4_9CREN|nr:ABC transporter ATP-binding protein [Vulcanisaeta souniana]BDR91027.1 dipeptide/oligopeptide/nickel ABC transporter ATP-binding protein [Vulcanisaeta souniana JCM 11219]GGI80128.1 dipeptide/oligopeptide/nickel ABC transporter ATP-binding protein [Vulcanisaeta souniana JCM 11219]
MSEFLIVDSVVKTYPARRRTIADFILRRRVPLIYAVNGASLKLDRGRTLVLLGESGSGKTTLGRLIVGLERPDSGRILVDGEEVPYVGNKAYVNSKLRGKLQMVFQDPSSSIDPFMSVKEIVSEPLTKLHLSKNEVMKAVNEALELVGLDKSFLNRRSSDLSGGQRQRVAIARAIITRPELVVLDEPTSALDASIQAQILNLLVKLQRELNLTYVFITHDARVAKFIADYVAVMYLGKVVEYGSADDVFNEPLHPYTQVLLSSVPTVGTRGLPKTIIGEVPSAISPPKGCPFWPRCPYATDACKAVYPQRRIIENREVYCHIYNKG